MAKLTCLLLCVVAASLTRVNAVSDEEKAAFYAAMEPIIAECSAEHGGDIGDIEAAKEAKDADAVKPCFIGCVLKKAEIMDSKGIYDAEKGLSKLRKFVKSDDDFAKFEKVAKECSKVNDAAVSDGDAGCERAKLVFSCFIAHKDEISM